MCFLVSIESFTDLLWGRFCPNRRHNMDQVPLLFVIGQDSTFTTADDNDVYIKSHGNKSLRKRQFMMHIVIIIYCICTNQSTLIYPGDSDIKTIEINNRNLD